MDELLKALLKEAEKSGNVKVVRLDHEGSCEPRPKDAHEDAMQDAMEIATMNKVLFDAHIKAGFTEEQAIKLVAANNI